MKILSDEDVKSEFFNECLSIQVIYKRLIKNPRKKVYGLSFNALLLIVVSSIFLAILKLFPIIDYYNHWVYCLAGLISCFSLGYGLLIYIKSKIKISELNEEISNNKLIVNEDFVELYTADKKYKIKSEDILFFLINKYSTSFFPKNGSKIIFCEVKHKNEIINIISDDIKIIDNSKLY